MKPTQVELDQAWDVILRSRIGSRGAAHEYVRRALSAASGVKAAAARAFGVSRRTIQRHTTPYATSRERMQEGVGQ
jgi:ActR/RegA family two-component response regulator